MHKNRYAYLDARYQLIEGPGADCCHVLVTVLHYDVMNELTTTCTICRRCL